MSAHKLSLISTRAAILGLSLLLPPAESTAVEWSASPSVSATASVNDNVNLEEHPAKTVWDYSVSPQLVLSANAPQWSLSGRAQLNRLEYPNASELSRTNDLLDLSYIRQYEHSQWALNGGWVHDSILESELATTGTVPVNVPATAQRSSRSVAPSWTLQIDERNDMSLAYSYQDVTYSNVSRPGALLDFTTKEPSITLSHALSEKDKVSVSLGYLQYESKNPVDFTTNQSRYNSKSAQAGYNRTFSETLSGSLAVGINKVDSTTGFLACDFSGALAQASLCLVLPGGQLTTVQTSSSTTSSLFSASLQKAFESSQFKVDLSRSLQPTGAGGLVETDRLAGSYNARISPTVNGSLDVSLYSSQSSTSSSDSARSRYYNISPAMAWQITELWTATTSYSRSIIQRSNSAQITGNTINLTVNYNYPKISRSR